MGLLLALAVCPASGKIDVALVTFGPGEATMSRFGHAAIALIADSGQRELYELAVGNFSGALPWYLVPDELIYESRPGSFSGAANRAFLARRRVDVHVLDLSPAQQTKFAALLSDHLVPDRASFEFRVFDENCTTRFRDLLDQVLDGRLRAQLAARPARLTYRDHTRRAFARTPFLLYPVDLFVGRIADRPGSRWDEAFTPAELAAALAETELGRVGGARQPVIQSSNALFEGDPRFEFPPAPPDLRIPTALAGLSMFGLFAWRARRRTALRLPERIVLGLFGLLGLLMLHIWIVGGERSASWNENLLVFSPLLLLLALAREPRRTIAAMTLLLLAVSILLKLAPGAQANWPWILFAGPTVAVLAWQVLRGHAERRHGDDERQTPSASPVEARRRRRPVIRP